jgi:N-acetylneuraminic acid mutarotase
MEPSLLVARRNPAVAVVGSNLYAATGFNAAPDYTTDVERFDGSTWTTMAPIPTPHAQGRAASVGTNIYVPGGYNSVSFGGPLDSMQIYSTTSNTWGLGAPLPAARSGVAAVAFNNMVYSIGGYNPVGVVHPEVYIYNPATNSYTTGAPMPTGSGNMPGVLYGGEIYVVGGGTAPGAHYAYNPTTNAWRNIAVLPTTDGLCQSSAMFVQDNEIWIVGCLTLPLSQQVWIYTPGSDSWRAGPLYNVDHQGPGGGTLNGRNYVVGGGAAAGGSTAVESIGSGACGGGTATVTTVVNTPTRTAVASATATVACGIASWSAGPNHVPGRYAVQGGLLNDGKYYVAGGQDTTNIPFNDVARFNPSTNAWEAAAPLPVAVSQSAQGTNGSKLFVAAGYLGGTTITSTLQIYDMASNSWSFGASLPATLEAAAGAVLNGKFYVVGGDDFNTTSLRSTYIYDIATNTWSTGPQIPDVGGRTNTYGIASGSFVYVFGGAAYDGSSNTPTDTLLKYDPVANSWTTLASAGTGGLGNYGAVSPYGAGKLFVTDGGDGGFTPSNTTHIYDIASNTWSAGPPMAQARLGHAQGTLPDGRVLVYAGLISSTAVTDASELLTTPSCGSPTATVPPTLTRTVTVVASATRTAAVNTATRTPITPGPTNTGPPQPSNTPGTPVATSTSLTPRPTPTSCVISFTDVPVGSTFYEYIRCLACRGIINGYPDGTFRPNNNVTRGQLSKIVSNSAGFSDPATQMFEDVPPGSTFFDYIGRLAARGYINGYPCGGPGEPCVPPGNLPYFRPNANATRGQISKIVSNAAGFIEPVSGQTFEDVPPGSTFYDFIERLASRNVMQGYPCGSVPGEPCVPPGNRPYFRPSNNATRGQTSKIVANTFFPNCITPSR